MRRRIKLAVALLMLLGGLSTLYAQKHPNVALGFHPDGLYQFNDLDSINLFSGNVIVRIPIGPKYPVGGQLSYQLTLTHNSNVWDYEDLEFSQTQCSTCRRALPNVRSNAGQGWRLSLGRLISYEDPHAEYYKTGPVWWIYESSAGDEHTFAAPAAYTQVFLTAFPSGATAYTAADSSGLRLVPVSATKQYVEFPNGEKHTFEQVGNTYRWRLTKIEDRFGNFLTITYTEDAGGRETKWTIDDSAGRQHTIDFEHSDLLEETDFDGQIVSTVKLAAPCTAAAAGTQCSATSTAPTATYSFTYESPEMAWPSSHQPQKVPPQGGYTPTARKLLKQIVLPTGEEFALTHHLTGLPGPVATITLPTKGQVSYTFGGSALPVGGVCGGADVPIAPAIRSKTLTTLDGSQTWDYVQTYSLPYEDASQPDLIHACEVCTQRYVECKKGEWDVFRDGQYVPPHRWARMTVFDPPVNGARVRRDNFFNIWKGDVSNEVLIHDPYGAHGIRYGLPITARAPDPGVDCDQLSEQCADSTTAPAAGYLSSRVFGNCPGAVATCSATNLLRSTYMSYGWATFDWQPVQTRTVFEDDSGCSDGEGTAEKCWIESQSSSDNGIGRFKTSTLSTNYKRTAGAPFTEYVATTAFPMWALTTAACSATTTCGAFNKNNNWLLDVFSEKTRTEGTATATTEFEFNTKGALTGTRVWKGTSRDAHDVLTLFDYDAFGNAIEEKYFGGDTGTLLTAGCCETPSGTPRYLVRNEYDEKTGVLSKSEYLDPATCSDTSQTTCVPVLTTAHYTVDSRSGLITGAYDSADVFTSYEYDAAFRLKAVTPTGAAKSSYTYTASTSAANAQVVETVTDGSTQITKSTYEFDGLGRTKRISKSIPVNPDSSVCTTECVAVTQIDYDALGRKWKVFQPVEKAAHPTTNVGDFWTTTNYDAFGRPISITTPDSKVTSFAYTGVRKTERTSQVATSANGSSTATTTEQYDAQGRLIEVDEAAGATTASRTTGDPVSTAYTYDVGGRLASVTMSHAAQEKQQTRTFSYDRRGFLGSETHPENGTTTYESYDALGHATKKTEGGVVLNYEFDPAERLTKVKSADGTTVLKEFKFATANVGANLKKGKLYESFRKDTRPLGGNLTITESYEYGWSGGQMSKVTSSIQRDGATLQESVTELEYDALRLPKTVKMPTCSYYGCTTVGKGVASVTLGRSNGLLANVGTFGTLTYLPSGMVNTVHHNSTPEAIDTYSATNALARPSTIKFGGGTACPSVTPSPITAPDAICGGTSGSASVPASQGITHTWAITGATPTSAAGEQVTFTAGATGTVTLTVTATRSSCGSTATSTKTVNITTAPTATLTSPSITIYRTQPPVQVQLSVTLTGPTPRQITWSDGVIEGGIMTDNWTRTVSPTLTTAYGLSAVSAGSCTGTASGTTNVTVIPPAPGFLTASTLQNRTVQVTWGYVDNVSAYQVERRTQIDGAATFFPLTSALGFIDNTVPQSNGPVAYIYFVRSVAAGTMSDYGPSDYAVCADTLYQRPELTPRATIVRASDLTELRNGVDALRAAFHVGPGSYSPSAVIRASHFTEIINALSAVRPFAYSGVPAPQAGGVVLAAHVQQLRDALR